MKNLKSMFIVFIAVLISTQIKSQTLSDIVSNVNTNYFEKQSYIQNNKTPLLDSAADWELKRYYRWQAFWDTRVDKNGEFITYINASGNYQANRQSSENIWESIGPKYQQLLNHDPTDTNPWLWVGRAQSVWVNPADLNIIYLGTNNGGLWRSENGGINWRLLTDEYAFGVHKIVVHPNNSDIMYIVTGDYANGLLRYGHYGQGIFKSEDAGETWSKLQDIDPEDMIYMSDIVFHPSDYSIMYAVSRQAVYKSTTGGTTWFLLDNLVLENGGVFADITVNPISPDNIVVSGTNEFHYSSDGGQSWSSNDFYTANTDDSKIRVDYSPSGVLYAFYYKKISSYSWDNFLDKSTDNGEIFTELNYFNNGYQVCTASAIFLRAFTENCIWLGGTRPWKSIDGGENIVPMDNGYYNDVHPDIRDICFPNPSDPNIVYVATDGGIDKNTQPQNNTWENLNGDLSLNEGYTISISEQNPEIMLIGTHDNGTYERYTDGTWRHVKGGDGGTTVISWDNDDDMFCAGGNTLYMYDSEGDSWSRSGVSKILAFHDSPVEQHPVNSLVYYL